MDGVTGPLGGAAGDGQSALPFDKAKLNAGWRRHFQEKQEKKQVAVVIDVPTGEQIAAVRMPLSYMLKAGIVPDRLTPAIEKQIALLISGDPKKSREAVYEDYKADAEAADAEWMDVLNFIWMNCCVLPKFVADTEAQPDDPENPTFPISSVELIDKLYLYEWCQGVNETVERFLQSTSEALRTLADEYSIPLSPEQLLRPDQPGGFLVGLPD
jgi:hypothetical protein